MTVSPGRIRRPLAFFLPSLDGGGAERVMLNIAAGLSGRGYRSDIVLVRAEGPYLAQVPAGIRIVDLKAPRTMRSLRPLAAYLRRERPLALLAALNHTNLVAMVASRLPGARTRTAISIHNTVGMEVRDTFGARTIPWLLGRLHRLADAIIAVSEGVASDLADRTGIPAARIDVIYNPVITPTLLPAAAAPPDHPWLEEPGTPVVLAVGRLTLQKNFTALVDAFAIVRKDHDARLLILGEGPDRAVLEARIRRHGLEDSIALPGFVENPYACMSRATVLVLSSHWEGLPTVLIESLAVGTPVVSTDCPSGPREILRNGALGRLVPPGDVPALARAMSDALTGGRVRPSPETLRPYMLDEVLDQYQRILRLDA